MTVNHEGLVRFQVTQPSKEFMFVYKVTNKITGKAYIGQTTRSISERWVEHCKPALKNRSYLSNAIQKHGKENFSLIEIGKATTQEELDKIEELAINEHNTLFPNGYNLRNGGLGGSHCQEVRNKLSKVGKGKIRTKKHKAALSKALTGRVLKTRKPIIGVNIKSGEKIYLDCANEGTKLGFDHTCIAKCCIGKRKKHKGFTWSYE